MKAQWRDHQYGGGATLTVRPGIMAQVSWPLNREDAQKGWACKVPSLKVVFFKDRNEAKAWCERALRHTLKKALEQLED